jgi:hypothetical protein
LALCVGSESVVRAVLARSISPDISRSESVVSSGMAPAVISDLVAICHDLFGVIRIPLRPLTGERKRRLTDASLSEASSSDSASTPSPASKLRAICRGPESAWATSSVARGSIPNINFLWLPIDGTPADSCASKSENTKTALFNIRALESCPKTWVSTTALLLFSVLA